MRLSSNWVVKIRDRAYKELLRFSNKDKERIVAAVNSLSIDPYDGDLEKMRGEVGVWRRRVGNYRIFFEIFPDDRIVYVFSVERRTSTTY